MRRKKMQLCKYSALQDGVDLLLVEEVMAQLRLVQAGEQHRHQLVETLDQGGVRVDVDDVDGERALRRLQRVEGVQHVLAEVAVAAGIQGEMAHESVNRQAR